MVLSIGKHKRKKVLIAFEFSGVVREAFEQKGFDVWSIDMRDNEKFDYNHLQDDIYDLVPWIRSMNFDFAGFHPPCTYTSVAGNRHYASTDKREQAVKQFIFWDTFKEIPMRYVEHPVSVISTKHRKPDQYIQPYQFGHRISKKTGLWLTNLPRLKPTNIVEKPELDDKSHSEWYNPGLSWTSDELRKHRSRFHKGIAEAMADQWSLRIGGTK